MMWISCFTVEEPIRVFYIKSDEKLTEKNKDNNPIEWAKLMNNYKNTAEEIILKEYIFI